ncbi:hypothetical protein C0J52_25574 [Blattella germanica]|nr:hypothetical protein C0J52_25574 [Blattella germanica]
MLPRKTNLAPAGYKYRRASVLLYASSLSQGLISYELVARLISFRLTNLQFLKVVHPLPVSSNLTGDRTRTFKDLQSFQATYHPRELNSHLILSRTCKIWQQNNSAFSPGNDERAGHDWDPARMSPTIIHSLSRGHYSFLTLNFKGGAGKTRANHQVTINRMLISDAAASSKYGQRGNKSKTTGRPRVSDEPVEEVRDAFVRSPSSELVFPWKKLNLSPDAVFPDLP